MSVHHRGAPRMTKTESSLAHTRPQPRSGTHPAVLTGFVRLAGCCPTTRSFSAASKRRAWLAATPGMQCPGVNYNHPAARQQHPRHRCSGVTARTPPHTSEMVWSPRAYKSRADASRMAPKAASRRWFTCGRHHHPPIRTNQPQSSNRTLTFDRAAASAALQFASATAGSLLTSASARQGGGSGSSNSSSSSKSLVWSL